MYYALLTTLNQSHEVVQATVAADLANCAHPANAAHADEPSLPRRPRAGAAIASAVVTCSLFASVVLGMTSMAPDGDQLVAQAHSVPRS